MPGPWDVDLIEKFLKNNNVPGRRVGFWFEYMDPKKVLDNRSHVFSLLSSSRKDVNPATKLEIAESMIPWNQHNAGIVQAFKSRYACGSVVKITYQKYTIWPSDDKDLNHRAMSQKGWNGVKWVVSSLNAGKPVRAYLKVFDHYVGIVGYRAKPVAGDTEYDFLVIDPWPGGASTGSRVLRYQGLDNKFMGEATQAGTDISYDTTTVTSVEGTHPFK